MCFALPEGQEQRGRGRGCELPCWNTKREKGEPVYPSAKCSLSRQRDFLLFKSKTLKKRAKGEGDVSCWGAVVLDSSPRVTQQPLLALSPSQRLGEPFSLVWEPPAGLAGTKPAVCSTCHGREHKYIRVDGLGGSHGHSQGWKGPPASPAQSPAPHKHLPQAGQAPTAP